MVTLKSMKNMTRASTSNFSQNILESLFNSNYRNMQKPEEENLNDLLRSKFFSPSRFSEEIEKVVLENPSMGYMDAIVFFCDNNNIDIESVPKLISKPLKERIRCEAIEMNLLKRTSRAKLPL